MIVTKTIGYMAMGGGTGSFLMAAASADPWGVASWLGAGFAGLVAGYLLVQFIPRMMAEHNQTIRHVTTEHKAALEKTGKDFDQAADKIVASHEKFSDRIVEHLMKDHK